MMSDERKISCVWRDTPKARSCGAHATARYNLCEEHIRRVPPEDFSGFPYYPAALIPCVTCGHVTDALRCAYCYEVETRLEAYLRRGGTKARAFVLSCLEAIPLGLLLLGAFGGLGCGGAPFSSPPGYEAGGTNDANVGGEQVAGDSGDGGEAGDVLDDGGEAGNMGDSDAGGEASSAYDGSAGDAAGEAATTCTTTPLAVTPHDLCPNETVAHAFPAIYIRSGAAGDCSTIAGFFNTPTACACAETYTCVCLAANGVGGSCGTIRGIPWVY